VMTFCAATVDGTVRDAAYVLAKGEVVPVHSMKA
jgi:hypothetical protein